MNIGDIRTEYTLAGLRRKDLLADPMQQFKRWFEQAAAAQLPEVNAMSIATVGTDGMPQVRTVLLKGFDVTGYVFYTNYASAKACEIEQNPQVSVLLPWLALERQVRISGAVEKVSQAESKNYFNTRPRGSQLGAWVSSQSEVIESRAVLEGLLEQTEEQFKGSEIPLPSNWGGYRIIPKSYEYWQGRANRLHDRFKYTLIAEGQWQINRLAP